MTQFRGPFRTLLRASLVLAVLVVCGCKSNETPVDEEKDYARPLPEGAPALVRVTDPAEIPDFRPIFNERERALGALEESIAYFGKPSSQSWFPYRTADSEITHEDQVAALEMLDEALKKSASADEFHGRCLLAFDVYKSVGWDGSGEVLYTAYCEPIFDGRLAPDSTYRFPLFKRPDDLVTDPVDGTPRGRRTQAGPVVPYYTRGELLQNGHLDGRELVYLKDPFEVYIAHVQGSARIDLPTGEQLCIGYAGKTDRPYKSIGLRLVEEGKIRNQDLSLTTLKNYFRDHPEEVDRVLSHNESFVFFMEREPGPFGSIGAKVTPYHTIATDKAVFPRGGPCIVQTRLPYSERGTGRMTFRDATCLVFDQDTGGAIRSAGRADLFVGTGPEAERLAGHTREVGRLYYLFIKK